MPDLRGPEDGVNDGGVVRELGDERRPGPGEVRNRDEAEPPAGDGLTIPTAG